MMKDLPLSAVVLKPVVVEMQDWDKASANIARKPANYAVSLDLLSLYNIMQFCL